MNRRPSLAALALCIASAPAVSGCGAEPDPTTPSLSYLSDHVFAAQCTAACHSGGDNAAGGLDMSADLHARLVSVPASAAACAGSKQVRVVPGDAEASLLFAKVMDKIDDAMPPCGDTMPQGVGRPALASDEAELIRAWINAGAPDD